MKTITLQIGNSDDKLKQSVWSEFWNQLNAVVAEYAEQIHFSGFPAANSPYQNACWVFECEHDNALAIMSHVGRIRRAYSQNSVAWTEGETEFV
jgi:hypothetical protein